MIRMSIKFMVAMLCIVVQIGVAATATTTAVEQAPQVDMSTRLAANAQGVTKMLIDQVKGDRAIIDALHDPRLLDLSSKEDRQQLTELKKMYDGQFKKTVQEVTQAAHRQAFATARAYLKNERELLIKKGIEKGEDIAEKRRAEKPSFKKEILTRSKEVFSPKGAAAVFLVSRLPGASVACDVAGQCVLQAGVNAIPVIALYAALRGYFLLSSNESET